MKEESKKQLRVAIKLLVVVACALLYAYGGISNKWLRRFLAPGIAMLFAWGYSRDWRYLVQMPVMFGTMSMGYGGDQLWEKIIRRGLFGLANGASTSIVNAWKKIWLLVGYQVTLLVSAYIVFGVWNPFANARIEETLLGVLCYLITIMSVKWHKDK